MKMKLRSGLIIIGILLALVLSSCKKEDIIEPTIVDEEVEQVVEEDIVEVIPAKVGIPSPLSGIYVEDEERVNRRPVAIMFDNHNRARLQAGLKDAEIIYEFLVEAPYTRYMGIYLINDPISIGAVRSARPYFITTVLEYDAIYVRVGGSEQAKQDIKSLQLADLDGLSSSNKVFWRKSHKKMPHNLYTSMEAIRQAQEDRNFRMTGEYRPFKFKEDESDIEGSVANKVTIKYNKDNTTLYEYDIENKIYTRTKDGKLHIDEIDDIPIRAKNIIIQEAKTKVIDKVGRLDIQLIGQGQGKYITNGKVMDIKWIKKTRDDKTLYYDLEDQEIIFNPGITWIQIVDLNPNIIIE